ncbi:MAG TPA: FAD-dependent oxidoreductase [Baekduia sp.]|nr:FAD-dependent oxidoreductase [Baekduia sp.]
MASQLPTEADVVIIGAGLSGLMTARRLLDQGVERVVIVEARDRIGGRVWRRPAANGRSLEGGGELVGPGMDRLIALADEFGLERMDLPFEGKIVRIADGERVVETYPYELAPELGEAHAAATAALDELAKTVPVDAPWTAPGARELDACTAQTWIDQNVADPAAAKIMASDFLYCGGLASEVSLLYVLWFLSARGGSEGIHVTTSQRLKGGSSDLVDGLVEQVGRERIFLNAPVRTVRHDDASVTVVTDAGEIQAKAVVAAIAPGLCGRINWEPVLPAKRDRLQSRYLGGHGSKLFGRYPEPWWRDRGFAGTGLGFPGMMVVMDVTAPDDADATLMAFPDPQYLLPSDRADALTDDAAARALFDDAIAAYFGDDAPAPSEFHHFTWFGDPWSTGCGAGLPPGLLTNAGDALRERVGRIVWAGTETGLPFPDWLEGALLSGERAADEAAALIGS